MIEFDITRHLLVFLAGYFLCLSGSFSQVVTNNELASPSTLGMDGLAVLVLLVCHWASVYLYLPYDLEYLSFISISGVTLLLLLVSLRQKKMKSIWAIGDMKTVVLIGLGFNLFVGAIFSIVQFLFIAINIEFPTGLWFGSFKQYQNDFIYIFFGIFILVQFSLKYLVKKLEIINIGSDFAIGYGIDTRKIQKFTLALSCFLTGLVISFFGVFSFLGLIFPHILRSFKFFSVSIKKELLIGPYITGALLSGLDVLCYNYTYYGAELPVGMISGILGSFTLIWLLFRAKKSNT